MKKVLKKYYKFIIGIIIGLIISSIGAYAATGVASAAITYDNSSSGLTSTTLQEAIDEVYEKIKPCQVTSGTGSDIGDHITCGSENFYIIASDTSTITMLAKYNLEIGSNWNLNDGDINPTAYAISNASNKQNGYCTGTSGVFRGTEYNYRTCSGNWISGYEQYLDYFISQLKINSEEINISNISIEQLNNLGCEFDEPEIGAPGYDGSCSNAPDWVYSSSYIVNSDMTLMENTGKVSTHTEPFSRGARPVLTITKNNIEF